VAAPGGTAATEFLVRRHPS